MGKAEEERCFALLLYLVGLRLAQFHRPGSAGILDGSLAAGADSKAGPKLRPSRRFGFASARNARLQPTFASHVSLPLGMLFAAQSVQGQQRPLCFRAR